METIYNLFTHCFNLPSNTPYQTVPKKNDDGGIEEARSWKESHRVDSQIAYKTSKKIQAYVHTLITDLKSFTITSTNKETVKTHLLEIASCSNDVRSQLINELASCKGDREVILEIRSDLATLVCKLP